MMRQHINVFLAFIHVSKDPDVGKYGTIVKVILFYQVTRLFIYPSFTKRFGTHNFYKTGRGLGPEPPTISETIVYINVKFCRVL